VEAKQYGKVIVLQSRLGKDAWDSMDTHVKYVLRA
jgi:hypothetical protein